MRTLIKHCNKYTKYLLIILVIAVIDAGNNRCFAFSNIITSITDFVEGIFSKKDEKAKTNEDIKNQTPKQCTDNQSHSNKTLDIKKISINPPFAEYQGYFKKEIKMNSTITDKAGKKYSLNDFKGKVVIVVLSTVWCSNCPTVLGFMDILQAKKINNLKIVALNIGDENIDEIEKHYKNCRINNLEIYQSVNNNVFTNLIGVPTSLIFDKNGRFVCGYVGCIDFISQKFISFINLLATQ